MKPLVFVSVLALLQLWPVALRAVEPANPSPTPPPAETTKMFFDLRGAPTGLFYYGTWKENVTPTKDGLRIHGEKGAQGQGGLGRNIDAPVNFTEVAYVEVALGVVVGNEVPEFTIALNDADGTQYSARLKVAQIVPGQPVWMRVRRDDFKLNAVEQGKDSVMDWTSVNRWHLQGDWSTAKACQVVFIALRTRR